MTRHQFKQALLVTITIVIVGLLGTSLFGSLGEPQVNDRLQLYETDLALRAVELANAPDGEDFTAARSALLGENPLDTALERYETVRKSAATNLNKFQTQLQQTSSTSVDALTDPTNPTQPSSEVLQLQTSVQQQQELINQLDLRIGILQAEQGQVTEAIATWTALTQSDNAPSDPKAWTKTASALVGMWSEPPQLFPNAEGLLQKNLEGWFRYKTLSRLYELQQRSDALTSLQTVEQQNAKQTLVKLALVNVIPVIGSLVGVVVLIVLGIRILFRKPSDASDTPAWDVPWNWETILQVLVLGFFFVGQVALPLLLASLGLKFSSFGSQAKAAYTLTYYLMMTVLGLLVLYFSIKPHFPLPEGWFSVKGKRNWVIWGIGGYLAALPLMIGVSLINQQIWQGQGGSNPLLQTVLEEGDRLSLGMFFFTASVAAPFFEETLFRGFLLPSLTKYVPVWASIVLSAFLFALAHLSLSEVLPLAVLGTVLGVVYTRSRSLLAPMLLHSLWNSVTMVGLFILGSGNN